MRVRSAREAARSVSVGRPAGAGGVDDVAGLGAQGGFASQRGDLGAGVRSAVSSAATARSTWARRSAGSSDCAQGAVLLQRSPVVLAGVADLWKVVSFLPRGPRLRSAGRAGSRAGRVRWPRGRSRRGGVMAGCHRTGRRRTTCSGSLGMTGRWGARPLTSVEGARGRRGPRRGVARTARSRVQRPRGVAGGFALASHRLQRLGEFVGVRVTTGSNRCSRAAVSSAAALRGRRGRGAGREDGVALVGDGDDVAQQIPPRPSTRDDPALPLPGSMRGAGRREPRRVDAAGRSGRLRRRRGGRRGPGRGRPGRGRTPRPTAPGHPRWCRRPGARCLVRPRVIPT